MADECSDFGLDGAVIMEGRRGLAGLAARACWIARAWLTARRRLPRIFRNKPED